MYVHVNDVVTDWSYALARFLVAIIRPHNMQNKNTASNEY